MQRMPAMPLLELALALFMIIAWRIGYLSGWGERVRRWTVRWCSNGKSGKRLG